MANFDDTIVAAVERVMPSVANVSDVKLIQDAYLQVHPVQGVGSGIVIHPDGYIITNARVVLGSQEIQVTHRMDGLLVAGTDRYQDGRSRHPCRLRRSAST